MIQDLTGQKFGRLTVVCRAEDGNGKSPSTKVRWLCRCECGNEIAVRHYALLRGNTKSCGCLSKEIHSKQNGLSSTRLYNVWRGIKKRCYNKNNHAYENYGGRGIYMCDEWRNNFLSFYNWSIQNGYKEGLTIDRIDNNLGYSPENCRWVTSKAQANNTRSNHIVEYDGKRLTLTQWSEKTGISRDVIKRRLLIGWSAEEALTTPVGTRTRWSK